MSIATEASRKVVEGGAIGVSRATEANKATGASREVIAGRATICGLGVTVDSVSSSTSDKVKEFLSGST